MTDQKPIDPDEVYASNTASKLKQGDYLTGEALHRYRTGVLVNAFRTVAMEAQAREAKLEADLATRTRERDYETERSNEDRALRRAADLRAEAAEKALVEERACQDCREYREMMSAKLREAQAREAKLVETLRWHLNLIQGVSLSGEPPTHEERVTAFNEARALLATKETKR